MHTYAYVIVCTQSVTYVYVNLVYVISIGACFSGINETFDMIVCVRLSRYLNNYCNCESNYVDIIYQSPACRPHDTNIKYTDQCVIQIYKSGEHAL